MKIHRTIFIQHPGQRPLLAVQDIVGAELAVDGMTDFPPLHKHFLDSLRAGEKVHLNHTYAGLHITGHLIADHAPNHTALQRRKAESRKRPLPVHLQPGRLI